MLWTLQRVFLGSLPENGIFLTDINGRELTMLIPLAIIVIFLGIYPSPLIDTMTTSINALVEIVPKRKRINSSAWKLKLVCNTF